MRSLVYYATHSGNTRRVANAIADALRQRGPVEVLDVSEGSTAMTADIDLVVVGGPTEGHGMIPEIVEFLDSLPDHALAGKAAAAFDTRLNWPRWASGSAGSGIRKRLELSGALRPVSSESFIVSMKPEIEAGELERAGAWGSGLGDRLSPALS